MKPFTTTLAITFAIALLSSNALSQHQITDVQPLTGRQVCAESLNDQGVAQNCIAASSVATLGMLYPLSNDLFVDPSTGFVGVGTTSPFARLEVFGDLRVQDTILCSTLTHPLGTSELTLRPFGGLSVGDGHIFGSDSGGSMILGGQANEVYDIGCVVAGSLNIAGVDNGSDERWATISGGARNEAAGIGSTIGGGVDNYAGGALATISGGSNNTAEQFSSVGGGQSNFASGVDAAIPGGNFNRATGAAGFAAGYRAWSHHDNTFVWSGSGSDTGFVSTAPSQFLIDAPGGVGIGTNTPIAGLSVVGPIESTERVSAFNPANPGANVHLSWLDDIARIRVGGSGAGAQNGFDIQTTSNNSLMRITGSGNVGIGTVTPGVRLDVAGSVRATGFINVSDARLKTNVHELDGALDKVRALRGVSFDWDPAELPEAEACSQLGFLAQEVREVLPEVVREDEAGQLAVAYTQLIPLLVEALQEQDREIAALRLRDEELRALIDELRAR